jgi:hypothetical protein
VILGEKTVASTHEKDLLEIFLSILIASAAAHVLSVIAVSSEINEAFWLLSTFLVIIIVVAIIIYVMDVKVKTILPFFKTLLIIVSTIFLFALARFFTFYVNKKTLIVSVNSMYGWLETLIFLCGITLLLLTIFEYRENKENKTYTSLAICVVIVFITFAVMYVVKDSVLFLRGAIT